MVKLAQSDSVLHHSSTIRAGHVCIVCSVQRSTDSSKLVIRQKLMYIACRSSVSSTGPSTPRGTAASAFAIAASRAVALSKAGADGGLPLLTMGGGTGLTPSMPPGGIRGGFISRDASRYAMPPLQSNPGSDVAAGQPTAGTSLVNDGGAMSLMLF